MVKTFHFEKKEDYYDWLFSNVNEWIDREYKNVFHKRIAHRVARLIEKNLRGQP